MERVSIILAVLFLAILFTTNLFAQDLKFSIPLPLTGPVAKICVNRKEVLWRWLQRRSMQGEDKGQRSGSLI